MGSPGEAQAAVGSLGMPYIQQQSGGAPFRLVLHRWESWQE